MSNIPGSKRKPSKFQVVYNTIPIRRELTKLAIRKFSWKIVEKPEETEEQFGDRIGLEQREVEQGADYVLQCARKLATEIAIANKIYPTCIEEIVERRIYWDRAIGICGAILQELQHLSVTLHSELNHFADVTSLIDKEIDLIRGIRKYDNKLKKNFNSKK